MSLRVAAFFATAKKYGGWVLLAGSVTGFSLQGYLYLEELRARLTSVETNETQIVTTLAGYSTEMATQSQKLDSLVACCA